jgi:hypothetical protein
MAKAVTDIMPKELKTRVANKEQEYHMQNRQIKGQQLLWMVIREFDTTSHAGEYHYTQADLEKLKYTGDKLAPAWLNRWDEVLLHIDKTMISPPVALGHIFERMTRSSEIMNSEITHWRRLPLDHPKRRTNGYAIPSITSFSWTRKIATTIGSRTLSLRAEFRRLLRHSARNLAQRATERKERRKDEASLPREAGKARTQARVEKATARERNPWVNFLAIILTTTESARKKCASSPTARRQKRKPRSTSNHVALPPQRRCTERQNAVLHQTLLGKMRLQGKLQL